MIKYAWPMVPRRGTDFTENQMVQLSLPTTMVDGSMSAIQRKMEVVVVLVPSTLTEMEMLSITNSSCKEPHAIVPVGKLHGSFLIILYSIELPADLTFSFSFYI